MPEPVEPVDPVDPVEPVDPEAELFELDCCEFEVLDEASDEEVDPPPPPSR